MISIYFLNASLGHFCTRSSPVGSYTSQIYLIHIYRNSIRHVCEDGNQQVFDKFFSAHLLPGPRTFFRTKKKTLSVFTHQNTRHIHDIIRIYRVYQEHLTDAITFILVYTFKLYLNSEYCKECITLKQFFLAFFFLHDKVLQFVNKYLLVSDDE